MTLVCIWFFSSSSSSPFLQLSFHPHHLVDQNKHFMSKRHAVYILHPCFLYGSPVEELNCKRRPIPICRLFFKINLLTNIAASCLTDFIRLEIYSLIWLVVCIFYPACELLPPWTKELYLCTVAPLSSL